MKDELLKLLVESIDLEKLVLGLVEGIGEKALLEAVAKSENKIDDAVVALILPAIKPSLEALIKAKVAELKASIVA
jgi:hypothetical protein